MQATLYMLLFSNGKSYVGLTRGRPEQRLRLHVNDARAGSQLPVHKAIRKHGEPRIVPLMIDELPIIARYERELIQEFGTQLPGGYNVDPGGQWREIGVHERRQMSKRAKAQDRSHLQTPEVRAKQGRSMRGVWQRPGYREMVGAKITAANVGRKPTPETKQKQSEAAFRRWKRATPEDYARAMRGSLLGAQRRWGA